MLSAPVFFLFVHFFSPYRITYRQLLFNLKGEVHVAHPSAIARSLENYWKLISRLATHIPCATNMSQLSCFERILINYVIYSASFTGLYTGRAVSQTVYSKLRFSESGAFSCPSRAWLHFLVRQISNLAKGEASSFVLQVPVEMLIYIKHCLSVANCWIHCSLAWLESRLPCR